MPVVLLLAAAVAGVLAYAFTSDPAPGSQPQPSPASPWGGSSPLPSMVAQNTPPSTVTAGPPSGFGSDAKAVVGTAVAVAGAAKTGVGVLTSLGVIGGDAAPAVASDTVATVAAGGAIPAAESAAPAAAAVPAGVAVAGAAVAIGAVAIVVGGPIISALTEDTAAQKQWKAAAQAAAGFNPEKIAQKTPWGTTYNVGGFRGSVQDPDTGIITLYVDDPSVPVTTTTLADGSVVTHGGYRATTKQGIITQSVLDFRASQAAIDAKASPDPYSQQAAQQAQAAADALRAASVTVLASQPLSVRTRTIGNL